MAEATAESPSIVLPNELMIEILSRVDLSNPLQLRCVCKLWKSLILDLQFMKKYLHRSHTEITVLLVKARQHYNAFRSQSFLNNLVMPQEQEDGDTDEEEGGGGGGGGGGGDEGEEAVIAGGGGDEEEEEEEEDEEENVDEEKDVEEEEEIAVEEEEDVDEEKDVEGDEKNAVGEEEEAGAEKHWLMNVVAQLDDILVDVRLLKEDLETIKLLRLIEVLLLQEDIRRVAVRYIEGNFKTLRVNMEAVEDRVECVKSFLQFCLKLATYLSSRI